MYAKVNIFAQVVWGKPLSSSKNSLLESPTFVHKYLIILLESGSESHSVISDFLRPHGL